MRFTSTRSNVSVSGAEAIVQGLASCGGLYVPERFANLNYKELLNREFYQISAKILSLYLSEFTLAELEEITQNAYSRFTEPAPVRRLKSGLYSLELWHGPTHAFKDIALTVLPALLAKSKSKLGRTEHTVILTATSGDTGKACLEGFKNADNISVVVLYPSQGVGALQKLQMTTQEGENVNVFGIEGNFDDAQTAAKQIFSSQEIKKRMGEGRVLSSANSINIGRLLPQIAYYFSSYCNLVSNNQIKEGDKIDFVVPSGNFGNILAGYYALKMGLPIGRLICASNKNNVLTEFFKKGKYNKNRQFYKTMSPSMDILVSSNLERLLFEICGRDANRVSSLMQSLAENGEYTLTKQERAELSMFDAVSVSEEDCELAIADAFDRFGYIMDTHTSIAYNYAVKNNNCTVFVSTASPCKFASDVIGALGDKGLNDFVALDRLVALGVAVPESLRLQNKPVRFSRVIDGKGIVEFFLKEGL